MSDNNPEEDLGGAIDDSAAEERSAPLELDAGKLVVFANPEKKGMARLGVEEYMPMATSRILLSAMPGCGKRNLIFNILHRMRPSPSVVHLVHHDPHCREYDSVTDMGIPLIQYSPDELPTLENIDNPYDDPSPDKGILDNPLIILDEITADSLTKQNQHRFERLVNHACTHRNATLICSVQSLLNVPPKARRGFNQYALWKQVDKGLNKMIASRASMTPETLDDLFQLCKDRHDFIYIDLDAPHDGQWRYRLNFLEPITIVPGGGEKKQE